MRKAEKIRNYDQVTVTLMNNIYEVQYLEKQNKSQSIKKISSEEYIVISTGEVKQFNNIKDRSESENSLRQTFKKLRYLINNNFYGSDNELFITFTYREVIRDTKMVYKDWRNFVKRLKRKWSNIEYLMVLEPQGESHGYCWHIHALMKFVNYTKIFIDNNTEIYPLWGHGFTQIKSIKEIDNLGAYLTAYLSDVEINQDENTDNNNKKRYKKGERLKYYPKGMNIYRKTKGIVMPNRIKMTYGEFKKMIGTDLEPVIRRTVPIKTDDYENLIIYEEYNTKRINTRK